MRIKSILTRRSSRPIFGWVVFLVLISCGIVLNKTVSAQTDAWSDGKAALLTDVNIKKLNALNAAIAVPTYIPEGYKIRKVDIQEPADDIFAFSFIYANIAGKTFTIESNNEALGDMAVKREVKFTNDLFKDSAQETSEFYAGHDEHNAKTVATEWLCSVTKYQPKTSKSAQCFQLLSTSKSMSPAEAMRIMSSLRYLKR